MNLRFGRGKAEGKGGKRREYLVDEDDYVTHFDCGGFRDIFWLAFL